MKQNNKKGVIMDLITLKIKEETFSVLTTEKDIIKIIENNIPYKYIGEFYFDIEDFIEQNIEYEIIYDIKRNYIY